jgi:hypothetical protein
VLNTGDRRSDRRAYRTSRPIASKADRFQNTCAVER